MKVLSWRAAIISAVVITLSFGIGWLSARTYASDKAELIATIAPSTASITPVSTTVPPTTTSTTVVPYPNMTGSDFLRITTEMLTFNQWLRAHPDPALVDSAYQHGSPAWLHAEDDMQLLSKSPEVAKDVRVISVQRVNNATSNGASVEAIVQYSGEPYRVKESISFVRSSSTEWRSCGPHRGNNGQSGKIGR